MKWNRTRGWIWNALQDRWQTLSEMKRNNPPPATMSAIFIEIAKMERDGLIEIKGASKGISNDPWRYYRIPE